MTSVGVWWGDTARSHSQAWIRRPTVDAARSLKLNDKAVIIDGGPKVSRRGEEECGSEVRQWQ